jgi:sortase A
VGVEDLKKGPGHYPKTPLPGQPGNTAIAGHRTTYGAPFYHLDSLKPGDPILIATHQGTFEYRMVSEQAVDPTDVAVIAPTADNRLTLTTCTPRFTARQRLVVVARLIGPATVPPPPPATPGPATPVTAPAAASVGSLSGQGTTTLPATAWGLACAALWLAAFLAGRRWRRWAVYAVATPVFLVALFFFFENFARFVPANL